MHFAACIDHAIVNALTKAGAAKRVHGDWSAAQEIHLLAAQCTDLLEGTINICQYRTVVLRIMQGQLAALPVSDAVSAVGSHADKHQIPFQSCP